MLKGNQILTLAKIGKLKLRTYNGIPIAVVNTTDNKIKIPYEKFKSLMQLEDIRLDWLLGRNNMIAGGSVLNWIWGEQTNEDIDFFFRNEESAEIFAQFIKGIGFKHTLTTGYASTYFEEEQGVILQIVGSSSKYTGPHGSVPRDFVDHGTPEEIIENFDFHVCKFAIDHEYVYTTSRAIQDLLMLTIDVTGNEKDSIKRRVLKYLRKGFFVSSKIRSSIIYQKNEMKRKRYDSEWPI